MTELERRAALSIAFPRVSYCPGSPSKRFARNLAAQASCEQPEITDRQAVALWQHLFRYRRQISDAALIETARRYVIPERRYVIPESLLLQ